MEEERQGNVATEMNVNKRHQSSPTLSTPQRPQKRVTLKELANHEASVVPRRLVSSVSAMVNSADNAFDSYTVVY